LPANAANDNTFIDNRHLRRTARLRY